MLKYPDGPFPPTEFTDKNVNGVIQPGDVIVLRDGSHSAIKIQNFYNELPITITGEVGARPVVNTVVITSAANWIIKCLNITTANPYPEFEIVTVQSQYQGRNLVKIFTISLCLPTTLGPAYDNVIERNSVFSYPDLEYYRNLNKTVLRGDSCNAIWTRCKGINVIGNYIYNNQ